MKKKNNKAKGQRKVLQAIGKVKNRAPRQKSRKPLDGGAVIPVAGYS